MNEFFAWLITVVSLFTSGKSLNEIFISFTINFLIDPGTPKITTQEYFDQLSIFFMFGIIGFLGEIIKRMFMAGRNDEMNTQLKELGKSFVFLFVFVGSMPFLVLGWQKGYNQIARSIALGLTGTNDPHQLIDRLSTLTGNAPVDVVLTGFQLGFLFIFGIGNDIIPICLTAGLLLLVVGVSFRWVPRLGEPLLNFSLSVVVYGIFGAGTSLLFIGMLSWAIEVNYHDNKFNYGLANTCLFGLAALGTFILLLRFKNQISTIVKETSGAIMGSAKAVRRTYHKVVGAGDKQVSDAMSARENRSKGSQPTGQGKLQTIPAPTTPGKPATEPAAPGASLQSTITRSRFRVNEIAAVAGKVGTAAATRNPVAGIRAGQAVGDYFKKLPATPSVNPKIPPTPPVKPTVPALPAAPPKVPAAPIKPPQAVSTARPQPVTPRPISPPRTPKE